jgi:hypothetical protein
MAKSMSGFKSLGSKTLEMAKAAEASARLALA